MRERRRLGLVRAGGDALALLLLLAALARCLHLAATSNALWALGAAIALVGTIAACARAVSGARVDECVADKKGMSFAGRRMRRKEVAAVAADGEDVRARGEAPGVRVTCVGGVRQTVMFRGAPKEERERAAAELREVLRVPERCEVDRQAMAETPEDFV